MRDLNESNVKEEHSMKELSEYNTRQILCGAIRYPLLIITVTEEAAMQIKGSILSLAREILYNNICKQNYRYKVYIRGYEAITVMPLKTWCDEKYKPIHEGIVIVTSRKITSVPSALQKPILLDDYLKGVQ